MKNIKLNRQVFDRTAFNDTVNTSFTELLPQQPPPSFFDPELATVEDFFTIYENLFLQIPKFGDVNSHEYLINESKNYVGIEQNTAEIEALLEEIADLRRENLELRQEMTQQITNIASSINNPNQPQIVVDNSRLSSTLGNVSLTNIPQ